MQSVRQAACSRRASMCTDNARRRERAIQRREELLEDRALVSRITRELKSARAKQAERMREFEWGVRIEATEDKHKRLDEQIQRKREFVEKQG
eukprot:COSAG01_NODE_25752_length_734_cov_1.781102_2_plen_92_part_01